MTNHPHRKIKNYFVREGYEYGTIDLYRCPRNSADISAWVLTGTQAEIDTYVEKNNGQIVVYRGGI